MAVTSKFETLASLAVAVLAAGACSPRSDPARQSGESTARQLPPIRLAVTGASNRMPSLAVLGERAVAVWTVTRDDVMNVYSAVSEDAGATFSEPRRVNDKPGDVSSNAEQPPRVAMSASDITVIWPSRLDGATDIRMARSTDGGRTFAAAVTLHESSITGARGWQGLTTGRDGVVHAVWLDGRHAAPSAGGHKQHGGKGQTGGQHGTSHQGAPRQDLYAAVIGKDGTITESHVARDVCFCCKTAVGVAAGGRVDVVWRHIFPASMRDVAMSSSTDGGRTFGQPVRVSEDNWQLSGCPDDGPAMAIDARGASHVVWPTLVNDSVPQKAIFHSSTTDGRTFTPRTRLSASDQEDAAHPQIAADEVGNVAAVWDEQSGGRRTIVLRTSRAGTREFGAPRVLNVRDSAFHPVIAGLDKGFLAAWAESGERSAIHVERVGQGP